MARLYFQKYHREKPEIPPNIKTLLKEKAIAIAKDNDESDRKDRTTSSSSSYSTTSSNSIVTTALDRFLQTLSSQEQIALLSTQIKELTTLRETMEQNLISIQDEFTALTNENKALKTQTEELSSRNKALESDIENLNKELYGLLFVEGLFLFEIGRQIALITILQNEIEVIGSFFNIVEFDNVAIITSFEYLDLVFE
jgi:chromosome segregation ATPase